MILKDEVIGAYKFILGREPESEQTIVNNSKENNLQSLRRKLILSNEFSNKYASMRNENSFSHIKIDDIESDKYIFMHVPKTGGTTLHSVLAKEFNHKDTCPERFNKLGNYKAGELASYTFFSGHYDYTSCQVIPGLNKKIFTILREPKARLISLYYFFRSHTLDYAKANNLRLPILANTLSFCEFLKSEEIRLTSNVFNPYVQLLTGRSPTGEFTKDGNTTVLNDADKQLLEFAKERLLSLTTFGILEKYDESTKLMGASLGLKLPQKVEKKMVLKDMVNKGSIHMQNVEREEFTTEHEVEVFFNTYLDIELYKYAQQVFEKRTLSGM